jgi:Tfp pilus assembly protein PilF
MAELDANDDRLSQLRDRWDRDRSSRVFVQLAEEYRRRGALDSALEVLEEGIQAHPRYLSAQVALGRVRLELGQAAAARGVFEQVTAQDPTHLLALKLLAESRLQLGDRGGAREALERYRLLGAPEAELAEIERRLSVRSDSSLTASAPRSDASFASLADEGPAGEPGVPAPVTGPGAVARSAARQDAGPGTRPTGGNGRAEVFHLPAVPPSPLPRPWAEVRGARRVEARGAREVRLPPAAPLRVVQEEVFTLWGGVAPSAAAAAGSEQLPSVLIAEPPGLGEEAAPGAGAEAAAEDGGLDAVESEAAEAISETSERFVEPAPEPTLEAGVEAHPADDQAGVEEHRAGEEATSATLGEIYLRQGHVEKAAEIFRRVLDHEPGNPAALQGLERIAGVAPLTAERLLAGQEPEVRGITARKIMMLQRYLERIRSRAGGDVQGTTH